MLLLLFQPFAAVRETGLAGCASCGNDATSAFLFRQSLQLAGFSLGCCCGPDCVFAITSAYAFFVPSDTPALRMRFSTTGGARIGFGILCSGGPGTEEQGQEEQQRQGVSFHGVRSFFSDGGRASMIENRRVASVDLQPDWASEVSRGLRFYCFSQPHQGFS